MSNSAEDCTCLAPIVNPGCPLPSGKTYHGYLYKSKYEDMQTHPTPTKLAVLYILQQRGIRDAKMMILAKAVKGPKP
jgi:hypothetical protein